jgi:hypothetical protein
VKNSYYIFLLLLIWGCANRIQPTGGPKDEDPPKVIASSPQYGTRNYLSQEVTIIFDEFINVKSLKEQLIITPRINGDYDYKINKRTITLEFEESFADSTTFTLNFREGIVDITESNAAENMLLAFSTGDLLDTLKLVGTLVDLMTKKPISAAAVGLYPLADTLDIFNGPPYYFTQTNENGNYVFNNIKDGDYRLYAFEDGNKNLICESDRESYAFLAQTITLDTAYIADTLDLQFLNIDTLKLTRSRASGLYFNVFANKYLTHAKLRAENDSVVVFNYTDKHKTLKIYNTFHIKDSLKVFATLQDSLGLVVQDSFYLKFIESSRKADEFQTSFKPPVASHKTKKISGEISFDKPLQQILLDSIAIKRDSSENYLVVNSFIYELDSLENILKYTIDIPPEILDTLSLMKEKTNNPLARSNRSKGTSRAKPIYSLSIPRGSFISIENDSSKASDAIIKFVSPALTGIINGSISSSYNSYTIQLLNNKMVVVLEHQNGKSYNFDEVTPGEYYIRILVDEDNNGQWDMADIRKNKQAEKVILYQDETGTSKTVIRANWEVTVDLSF